MKKIFAVSCMLFVLVSAYAQDKEGILGKWESEHGGGRIQIHKTGDKYSGTLVWIRSPNDINGKPQLDSKNPSPKFSSRPVVGIELLKNFVYKGNGQWEEGTVYDPKSGKTYSCKMSLLSSDKLKIRGYIGMSFIGKSEVWTKVP